MDEAAETSSGMTRRTLIKRGAVVGGTLMWAAPVVDSFVSPAFGQAEGTPPPVGRDFSYVAFLYTCGDGVLRSVKFELDDTGQETDCEFGEFAAPACEAEKGDFTEGAEEGDCSHFRVSSPDDGGTIVVTFVASQEVCNFGPSGGNAFGKCGQTGCVPGTAGTDALGRPTLTFALCS